MGDAGEAAAVGNDAAGNTARFSSPGDRRATALPDQVLTVESQGSIGDAQCCPTVRSLGDDRHAVPGRNDVILLSAMVRGELAGETTSDLALTVARR